MAKKSLETLVQSIRESLAEIKSAGDVFAIASWPEADGGGGYMIHIDGRMMPVDDYQYGFSHINELISDNLSVDVQKYARQEAGRIASSITPLSADPDLKEYAQENVAFLFGVNSSLVERGLSSGATTLEDVFELYTSLPQGAYIVHDDKVIGNVGTAQATVDVAVSNVIADPNTGKLTWQTQTLFPAGTDIRGFERSSSLEVDVPGGTIHLDRSVYSGYTAAPPRRCTP